MNALTDLETDLIIAKAEIEMLKAELAASQRMEREEKAEEQSKQLLHELCKLACESVEREKTLAKLEAEVAAAVGEGCDYCLSTWPERAADGFSDIWNGNKLSVGYGVYREIGYCPMCGRRLGEYHEDD